MYLLQGKCIDIVKSLYKVSVKEEIWRCLRDRPKSKDKFQPRTVHEVPESE